MNNHVPKKQNMRRPAPNRNANTSGAVRQPQRPAPAHIQPPNRSRTVPPQRAGSQRPRSGPTRAKPKQYSRNFILAALFAALIIITIIISTVQSCTSNEATDGIVTTAPPKTVNRGNYADDINEASLDVQD